MGRRFFFYWGGRSPKYAILHVGRFCALPFRAFISVEKAYDASPFPVGGLNKIINQHFTCTKD
jgi:hypothetical protein